MSASTTNTRITKGRDGWEAQTIIDMGTRNRVLVIRTAKTQGGMVNTFTVNTDNGNGFLSWVMFQDYSKRTVYKGTRCTEKSVRDLHAQALKVADLHLADAAKQYEAKDREENAQALGWDSAEQEAQANANTARLRAECEANTSDAMNDVNYVGHPCHY